MPRPSNGKKKAAGEVDPQYKPTVKRAKKKEEEPRPVSITVSASAGGKVALVSYGNETNEFSFFNSIGYVLPEDWTAEQAEEWRMEETIKLKEQMDVLATAEYKALWKLSEVFTDDGEYIG